MATQLSHTQLRLSVLRSVLSAVVVVAVLATAGQVPRGAQPSGNTAFNVAAGTEQAFGLNVSAAAPLKVEVRWSGSAAPTVSLYGAGSKTPYAQQTGASPIVLSHQLTAAAMTAKPNDAMAKAGVNTVIRISAPTTSPVQGTVTVVSPAGAVLKPLGTDSASQPMSEASALIVHLMDRYANDAPNKNEADKRLAAVLDKDPQAKKMIREGLARFKSKPLAHRQALMGAKWANRPLSDAVSDAEIAAFKEEAQKFVLPELTPRGIRGVALPPSPGDAPNPTGGRGSRVPVIGSLWQLFEPRLQAASTYRVDFAGIYCQKETWFDQFGNDDEPYVIFVVTDGYNATSSGTWKKQSNIYTGVDSAEAYQPYPWLLSLYGQNAPAPAPAWGHDLGVDIILMESDTNDYSPGYYMAWALYYVSSTVSQYAPWSPTAWILNVANGAMKTIFDAGNDDEISRGAFTISAGSLDWYSNQSLLNWTAPNGVKLTYSQAVTLPQKTEWWNYAKYQVMLKVRKAF